MFEDGNPKIYIGTVDPEFLKLYVFAEFNDHCLLIKDHLEAQPEIYKVIHDVNEKKLTVIFTPYFSMNQKNPSQQGRVFLSRVLSSDFITYQVK